MRKRVKFKFKLNKYYPWLKFAILILIFLFVYLGARGVFLNRTGELAVVPASPMSRQSKVPERVFRGNLAGKKLIALTFDDGPSQYTTPQLLDILQEKKAVATFFELGVMARRSPEVVQRVVEQGNELGSHTNSHQNLPRLSRTEVETDKNEADAIFAEIVGFSPEITRPPYGNFNQMVMEVLNTPLILWSIDTRDWESKDPAQIKEIAVNQAKDGSILLFHDIYQTTVEAIPEIIDVLRERGFEMVTVSELAEERGVELNKNEYYREFSME